MAVKLSLYNLHQNNNIKLLLHLGIQFLLVKLLIYYMIKITKLKKYFLLKIIKTKYEYLLWWLVVIMNVLGNFYITHRNKRILKREFN